MVRDEISSDVHLRPDSFKGLVRNFNYGMPMKGSIGKVIIRILISRALSRSYNISLVDRNHPTGMFLTLHSTIGAHHMLLRVETKSGAFFWSRADL